MFKEHQSFNSKTESTGKRLAWLGPKVKHYQHLTTLLLEVCFSSKEQQRPPHVASAPKTVLVYSKYLPMKRQHIHCVSSELYAKLIFSIQKGEWHWSSRLTLREKVNQTLQWKVSHSKRVLINAVKGAVPCWGTSIDQHQNQHQNTTSVGLCWFFQQVSQNHLALGSLHGYSASLFTTPADGAELTPFFSLSGSLIRSSPIFLPKLYFDVMRTELPPLPVRHLLARTAGHQWVWPTLWSVTHHPEVDCVLVPVWCVCFYAPSRTLNPLWSAVSRV